MQLFYNAHCWNMWNLIPIEKQDRVAIQHLSVVERNSKGELLSRLLCGHRIFVCEFRSSSECRSIMVDEPYSGNQSSSQSSEERNTRTNAQVFEKGQSSVNHTASERSTEKVIGRQEGSSILRVGKNDVKKDALKNDKIRKGQKTNADQPNNPVYRLSCCPRKHEKSNRRQDAGGNGWFQSFLINWLAGFLVIWLHVVLLIENVGQSSQNSSNNDGYIGEARCAQAKVVYSLVHKRE